ncbi:MAG: CotH kinase family protein, partial [Verrucomicrobiales bacterium]
MKELNPFVLRTSARSLHYVFLIGLLAGPGLVTAGTYTQSFEFGDGTTNLGDGSVINSNNGTAANFIGRVHGGRLRMSAPPVQSTASAFRLPDLDPNKEIRELTMDFDLTLNNTAGARPADGLAMTFGAIPSAPASLIGSPNLGEEGFTANNSLAVLFDTYDNGGLEAPSIDAKAHGAILRAVYQPSWIPAGSVNPAGGQFPFDGTARHITIHWDSVNGIDVTYNGVAIMTDVPTGGFIPAAGNVAVFTARTGGAFEDVLLDNLVVSTVAVNPIETGGPVLSEFMAFNEDTREDENCEPGAWIEIYNGQNSSVNLSGWFLTDDPGNLGKWTIPAINMAAYSYLTIWADGKNRTTAPNYHTNFTLNPSPGPGGAYLALVKPDSTVASSFTYNTQAEDISFGLLGEAQTPGFFETPSPRVKNSGVQAAALPPTDEVAFSRAGGLITGPINLDITAPVPPGAVVRYTTDNSRPTGSSPAWPAGGLTISDSTTVRARLYLPNSLGGPIDSRAFILLDSSLTNYRGTGQPFSSNLPIIVFHSFGNRVDTSQVGTPGLRDFLYTYGVTIDPDPSTGNRATITGPIDFQGRGGVHVRGETSAGFPQRPYSWELWDNQNNDKDASLFGLPADSDWALISNFNDKSLLRNKLPFDTMYDINGEGSAMREIYVEVFFRQDATGPIRYNDYRGVYVFTERIKRHQDRVNIDRLDFCEGVYTGNPAVDDVSEISGGYIFRKDKNPQTNPFTIATAGTFQVYEPDLPSPAQLTYIGNYMNRFNTALNGATFADPVDGYAKYIVPETFIDNHLWVEIFKQIDGYRLSTYYTKDRGERVTAFPLWDYNLSLGNANYNTGDNPTGWYYTVYTNSPAEYHWYARMFQDPNFLLDYWDRYWQLRRSKFSTANIMAEIDAMVAELSDNNPAASVTNGVGNGFANGRGEGNLVSGPLFPASIPSVDNPAGRHNARWQRLGMYNWPNANGYPTRNEWNSPVDPAAVEANPTAVAHQPFNALSDVAHLKLWLIQRLLWMDSQSMSYGANVRSHRAPDFSQYGGDVPSGYQLTMTNPNTTGTIYYTLDGSDPQSPGASIYSTKTVSSRDLIAEGATLSYLVPSTANGGDLLTRTQGDSNQWNGVAAPPNQASWLSGPMGVGFDYTATNPDFSPFIATNVQSVMQPPGAENATIYLRMPFAMTAEEVGSASALRLRARYEDAYIAYLNGVEVARKTVNAAFNPTWNSQAGSSRSDASAITFETVDITSFKSLLQTNNILAVHAMNAVAAGTLTAGKDFLFNAKLEMDTSQLTGLSSITISNSTQVQARVQIDGLWGPLTDANFIVNGVPASAANLVISEMHYNPLDPTPAETAAGANNANDFEFIEIMNISGSSVDLTNCRFTLGVTFNWFDAPAAVQTLAPGQRMVICENLVAFNLRYGASGAVIAGAFVGNLANAGEAIRFVDA